MSTNLKLGKPFGHHLSNSVLSYSVFWVWNLHVNFQVCTMSKRSLQSNKSLWGTLKDYKKKIIRMNGTRNYGLCDCKWRQIWDYPQKSNRKISSHHVQNKNDHVQIQKRKKQQKAFRESVWLGAPLPLCNTRQLPRRTLSPLAFICCHHSYHPLLFSRTFFYFTISK